MWQQWINALLGLLIIAVPFLNLTANTLMWTLVLSGAAVAILAIWGGAQEKQMERELRYRH